MNLLFADNFIYLCFLIIVYAVDHGGTYPHWRFSSSVMGYDIFTVLTFLLDLLHPVHAYHKKCFLYFVLKQQLL